MSSKLATLHEVQTVYSLKDVYDMLEIAITDAENQTVMMKRSERE